MNFCVVSNCIDRILISHDICYKSRPIEYSIYPRENWDAHNLG